MSALAALTEVYRKHGLELRTGLSPWHFGNPSCHAIAFTALFKDGRKLSSGGGISMSEIIFFEALFAAFTPARIFIVGNAFGVSTILLAMLNRTARVVAIDAEVEGFDNVRGTDFTNEVLRKEGLNGEVVRGFSPADVPRAAAEKLGGAPDFVLIDGLHTLEQQALDFNACFGLGGARCLYCLHDVLNWRLRPGFERLARQHPDMVSKLLWRTSSGMGVLHAASLPPAAQAVMEAFTEPDEMLERTRREVRMARFEGLVPPFARRWIPAGLVKAARRLYYRE